MSSIFFRSAATPSTDMMCPKYSIYFVQNDIFFLLRCNFYCLNTSKICFKFFMCCSWSSYRSRCHRRTL